MSNADTDLIFPPRAIPALSNERGPVWKDLVDSAQIKGPDSPDQVAFILMMAHLDNCATCNADSYRAVQGCTSCARQALKRFHGSDEELVRLFKSAMDEVKIYFQSSSPTKSN